METIITALIFYFLGRFAGTEVETVKKIKKVIIKPKAQVIDYPTAEEEEYENSEERKADEDRLRLQREAGIV